MIQEAYVLQSLSLAEAKQKQKTQEEELNELRLLLDSFREEMVRHVEEATELEEDLKESRVALTTTKRKLEESEMEVSGNV